MKNEQCEQKPEERKQDGFEPGPMLCKRGPEWFHGLSREEREKLWNELPRTSRDELVNRLVALGVCLEKAFDAVGCAHNVGRRFTRCLPRYLFNIAAQLHGFSFGAVEWDDLWWEGTQDIPTFTASVAENSGPVALRGTAQNTWDALYQWDKFVQSLQVLWQEFNQVSQPEALYSEFETDRLRNVFRAIKAFEHGNFESKMYGFETASQILGLPIMAFPSAGIAGAVSVTIGTSCVGAVGVCGERLSEEWAMRRFHGDYIEAAGRLREDFIRYGFSLPCLTGPFQQTEAKRLAFGDRQHLKIDVHDSGQLVRI